jgi:hypothetical protein
LRLTVTDPEGRQLTLQDGKIRNEIPNVRLRRPFTGLYNDDRGWILLLPTGTEFKVIVAQEGEEENIPLRLSSFAPGQVYRVNGIELAPEQEDAILFTEGGGTQYSPGIDSLLTFNFIVDDFEGENREYTVTDVALSGGRFFAIEFDDEEGEIHFSDNDPDLEEYDVSGTIYTEDGEEIEIDDIFFDEDLDDDDFFDDEELDEDLDEELDEDMDEDLDEELDEDMDEDLDEELDEELDEDLDEDEELDGYDEPADDDDNDSDEGEE